MSMFQPSDYFQYSSVNEWFIRNLKQGVRPIAGSHNRSVIVSPADSRAMVFSRIPYNVHKWVKGEIFDIASLLQMPHHPFTEGNMILCRLAPQDYHNFHSPLDASVVDHYEIEGRLHSVNFDAVQSQNRVLFNRRTVLMLENPQVGKVAFVAIGALSLGSVILLRDTGDQIRKGEKLGYFQFGGSSLIVLFEKNKIEWDPDLILASLTGVETLISVNSEIATLRDHEPAPPDGPHPAGRMVSECG